MELVIRIALMFFFIQFLVVVTTMTLMLLLARQDIPGWEDEPGFEVFTRWVESVIHLPSRGYRSIVRRVQSAHLHSVH